MAIATGTAAVLGAGLTTAGVLGSSAMQNSAAKRAAKAQEKSDAAALEFEQKKYADSQAREQRMWDDYLARRASYDAGRSAILAKYGINIPGAGGGGAVGGGDAGGITIPGVPGRMSPSSAGSGGGGGLDPSAMLFGADPMDAGGMTGEGGDFTEALDAQLPDPDDWSNWGNYGVR